MSSWRWSSVEKSDSFYKGSWECTGALLVNIFSLLDIIAFIIRDYWWTYSRCNRAASSLTNKNNYWISWIAFRNVPSISPCEIWLSEPRFPGYEVTRCHKKNNVLAELLKTEMRQVQEEERLLEWGCMQGLSSDKAGGGGWSAQQWGLMRACSSADNSRKTREPAKLNRPREATGGGTVVEWTESSQYHWDWNWFGSCLVKWNSYLLKQRNETQSFKNSDLWKDNLERNKIKTTSQHFQYQFYNIWNETSDYFLLILKGNSKEGHCESWFYKLYYLCSVPKRSFKATIQTLEITCGGGASGEISI